MRQDGTLGGSSPPMARAFSRQLLLGMIGGIILMFSTLFTTWWMAAEQDQAVRDTSRRMVAGGIDAMVERIQTMLLDYAVWTSAFDHITAGDFQWIANNIGASAQSGTFDMTLILPPAGDPIGWSTEVGPVPAAALLDPDELAAMDRLIDPHPIDDESAPFTFVRSGDVVWLASIARVVPQEGVPAGLTDAMAPRLILVNRVSDATVADIAARFGISNLTVDNGPRPGFDSLPLAGPDGKPVAWVNWSSPTPGRAILEAALGPLVALMLAVGIVALLASRELVRSARELEAALDRAQTADRMKTEFLGNVSHELRTPLNGVIGIAQLLQLRTDEPESCEMLDLLLASARSQLQLVNGLLDITRIETGSLSLDRLPFDPAAALEETLCLIAPDVAAKKLALDVDIAPEVRRLVLGDALAFQQVMTNLVGNAMKFTDTGRIFVSLRPAEEGLVAVVADTGVGIDPAQHNRIFERFVQVDSSATRRVGGAGLGLAITRALIELMRGTITVDSTLGEGSRFTVTLPLPAADSLASAA